ncbi:hypothetical protein [Chitinophaga nivalis]|uniref:YD repeat-containing protein n=1 Tax=Chitinophaga nivalis TaxID=2991709 RepID=A0ABT3IQZ3_9BACT|nr:hypothetical protein [Chitinophaga nivalis]MCW3463920.1 hypothetical protein [Chitinophaga nivalis]MCW3486390.1 hypothetical protein [Chitinophaga nivalis]
MKKTYQSTQVLFLFISLFLTFSACKKNATPLSMSGSTSASNSKASQWLLSKKTTTGPANTAVKTYFYNAQHQLTRSVSSNQDTTTSPFTEYYTYNSNGLLSYITNSRRQDTIFFQYDQQNRLISHSGLGNVSGFPNYFKYYYKANNISGVTYYTNGALFTVSSNHRTEHVYDAAGNIITILKTSVSAIYSFPGQAPDTSLIPIVTRLTYDDRPNVSRSLNINGPGHLAAVDGHSGYYPIFSANNVTDDGFYYYRYTYNKNNLVQSVSRYDKYSNTQISTTRFEYIKI